MQAILGLPLDILVAVGVLVVFLLLNYTVGKNRPATLLLAMYIAGAIIMLVPVIDILPEVVPVDSRLLPILEFAGITAIVYVVLARCRYFDPYVAPCGWESGVFSVLHAVLALSIVVSLEPAAVTATFSPNFARVFLDPMIRSVLLCSPLLVFLVMRGNESG